MRKSKFEIFIDNQTFYAMLYYKLFYWNTVLKKQFVSGKIILSISLVKKLQFQSDFNELVFELFMTKYNNTF